MRKKPLTKQELEKFIKDANDLDFQLKNVISWLELGYPDNALIKATCLSKPYCEISKLLKKMQATKIR